MTFTSNRLITPSQLALHSRSPVIGAAWEELHATDPQRPPRPATQPLDQLLWDSDLEHEQVLLRQLQPRGKRVVDLRGRQDEQDDAATLEATRSRGRRRRYSIANVEQLSRQCRLTQTPSASSSHSH